MENPDVKALRDEITMMISENRKKDRIIDELAKQMQDLTKQNQYMTKQNLDVIGSARCRPHQLPSAQTTKQNLDVIG